MSIFSSSLKKESAVEKNKKQQDLNKFIKLIEDQKKRSESELSNLQKNILIKQLSLDLKIVSRKLTLRKYETELETSKRDLSIETLDSMIDERKIKLKDINDLIYSKSNELMEISKTIENNKKHLEITGEIIYDHDHKKLMRMDGFEFEKYIANLLKYLGFTNIVRTQDSNDQGLDVIAEKNGQKIGIQCKLYSSVVGNTAVQQVIAGKAFYKLDKAIVITNSFFTDSARKLAIGTDTELIDKNKLNKLIYKVACSGNYLPYHYKKNKVNIEIIS